MHPQAYDWVAHFSTKDAVSVLDIGGRNINGSVRELFPAATQYVAVDLYDGPGVDVACDITLWDDDRTFDVVVCAEVLEHAENWRGIIGSAYARCSDGGTFIMTCAGPGRQPHSGVDGQWRLLDGEHYANITPEDLEACLAATGWTSFTIDQRGEDVRCVAVR